MNIENKKQFIIILLAIGLGLAATGLTGKYIQSTLQEQTAALAREYETQRVQPLLQEMQIIRGEIQNVKQQQDAMATNLTAQLAQRQMEVKQEAPSALPRAALPLRIPPGKRAYTVVIDSLSAVGGLISPGDYVDVLGHLNVPDPITNLSEVVTAIVFQNIQIIAVGTNITTPGSYETQAGSRSLNITFALDPEQIALFSFAQRNGNLQLVLRPPAETDIQMLQASNWNALSNYVLEKQGTELVVPRLQANIEPVQKAVGEVRPYIQIFRRGEEL